MFSHITIGARDLTRLIAFYDRVLAPLGIGRVMTSEEFGFAGWRREKDGPTFFVTRPHDGNPALPGNGTMTAFTAPDRAAVDAAHAAGLAAGGSDEGPPGLRPHYAPDYYGAYLRDPEGNKLHVVHRGG
jgi:catechol 2,3-dioxygenase-like lactoylglutathione lyase family enzyme